jgi:hypothetical protein
MKIIKQDVRLIDLTPYVDQIGRQDHKTIFLAPPGNNHYALLAYLAFQLTGKLIVELGTHYGSSSLAMSINDSNTIITYDIADRYGIQNPPKNITRRIGDIFKLGQESILLDASLIFLDTAHTGEFEQQVYDYLCDNNYQGILLLDDIHWNQPMKSFWNSINVTKYDITDIGHGICPDGVAGTGIVDFSNTLQII